MKITHIIFRWLLIAVAIATAVGCSNDDTIDNRDRGFGYVQFKLYKEASYEASSRSTNDKLAMLAEACKIKVTLLYNNTTITQAMVLNSSNAETAEFGLRSDKLKLVVGEYRLQGFYLYDKLDKLVYTAQPDQTTMITINEGGLTMQDLTIVVTPRGKVKFTFTKDLHVDTTPTTRAGASYAFDEIKKVNLSLTETKTNEKLTFTKLPAEFNIHFDESGTGYETSTLSCDSLLSIKAGSWKVSSYEVYDDKKLLEYNAKPAVSTFTVTDNQTTEASVAITLNESADYIKDYVALRDIWVALDGPNWSYHGQDFPAGANWDFNKDVDLWGVQPGVKVHSNGRVALLSLGEFNIKGAMPAAIGNLTALVELYLGTHNDVNGSYVNQMAGKALAGKLSTDRIKMGKAYLREINGNPYESLSQPLRRAYADLNLPIPGDLPLDKQLTPDQISPRPMPNKWTKSPQTRADVEAGTYTNGLTSLPEEIGNLTNLQTLMIANGKLKTLPAGMKKLTSLTDLEIYNCQDMTEFPLVLAEMPALVSLNISSNPQWTAAEFYKGIDALANGASAKLLQLFYANSGNLEEIPESIKNMTKLGLISFISNKITKIHPFGADLRPIQLLMDNNKIKEIPVGADGLFCGFDGMEDMSFSYNELTEVPNLFICDEKHSVETINFSYNKITKFADNFTGLECKMLDLTANLLTEYPKVLATTNSQVMQFALKGNRIRTVPEGSFDYNNSYVLQSLDISYNRITELPIDFNGKNLPYLYGIDLSSNAFAKFPFEPLNSAFLTSMIIRGQRDDAGNRCLKEWPTGLYNHKGLRGFFIGSNDLRKVDDTISYLIYYLDISDNPNIVFDASKICSYIQAGLYFFFYDHTQDIRNCDALTLD